MVLSSSPIALSYHSSSLGRTRATLEKVVHPDGSAPSRHDFAGGLGDGDQSKQDTWGSLVPNTNRELAKDEESEPKNST